MSRSERIVAVGLLTAEQVRLLGSGLRRSWPVEEAPTFADLLAAIDVADDEHRLALANTGQRV